jgi:hypothetical protein
MTMFKNFQIKPPIQDIELNLMGDDKKIDDAYFSILNDILKLNFTAASASLEQFKQNHPHLLAKLLEYNISLMIFASIAGRTASNPGGTAFNKGLLSLCENNLELANIALFSNYLLISLLISEGFVEDLNIIYAFCKRNPASLGRLFIDDDSGGISFSSLLMDALIKESTPNKVELQKFATKICNDMLTPISIPLNVACAILKKPTYSDDNHVMIKVDSLDLLPDNILLCQFISLKLHEIKLQELLVNWVAMHLSCLEDDKISVSMLFILIDNQIHHIRSMMSNPMLQAIIKYEKYPDELSRQGVLFFKNINDVNAKDLEIMNDHIKYVTNTIKANSSPSVYLAHVILNQYQYKDLGCFKTESGKKIFEKVVALHKPR